MAPDKDGVCLQIVGYLVAFAVLVSGVELLAFVAMSNHWHGGNTDVEAKHGMFLSTLNGLLGRVFNSELGRGRGKHFWDAQKPCVQRIIGLDAHIEQFIYLALNPVRAGLVPTAAEWPGFVITPDMIGKTLTFQRPDLPFFRTKEGHSMPEEIELHIHEPPGAEDVYGPGGYALEVARRLEEAERKIQLERGGTETEAAEVTSGRVAGTMRGLIGASAREDTPTAVGPEHARRAGDPMRGFLGLDKLFRTDPLSTTPPPEKRGYLCEIICCDRDRVVFEVGNLQEFRRKHRVARKAMENRKRLVVFPAGTYALRLYYGVKVAPPDNDDLIFARAVAEHEQMRAAA